MNPKDCLLNAKQAKLDGDSGVRGPAAAAWSLAEATWIIAGTLLSLESLLKIQVEDSINK